MSNHRNCSDFVQDPCKMHDHFPFFDPRLD